MGMEFASGNIINSYIWAFGPSIHYEKRGRAGVPARHSTGLMVRRTHPTLNFGGTGFQPVHRTGKMPAPPKTFVSGSQAPAWEPHCRQALALRENHLCIAPGGPSRSLGTRERRDALRFPALRAQLLLLLPVGADLRVRPGRTHGCAPTRKLRWKPEAFLRIGRVPPIGSLKN